MVRHQPTLARYGSPQAFGRSWYPGPHCSKGCTDVSLVVSAHNPMFSARHFPLGVSDTAPWGSLGTVTWGSPLQSSIQRNGPTCLQTPASVQTAQPHSNSKSSWWPWPWGHQEGQFPGENIANTMSHCSNSPMVHQVCIPLWRQRESLSLALWSEQSHLAPKINYPKGTCGFLLARCAQPEHCWLSALPPASSDHKVEALMS